MFLFTWEGVIPFLPAIVSSFSYVANINIPLPSMKSKICFSFLCPDEKKASSGEKISKHLDFQRV
jgi:hypothetical protein